MIASDSEFRALVLHSLKAIYHSLRAIYHWLKAIYRIIWVITYVVKSFVTLPSFVGISVC